MSHFYNTSRCLRGIVVCIALTAETAFKTQRKGRGMSMHATGTHDMKTWDEKTWDGKPANEVSGAKLTRASVTNSFHGDIEGEGTLEYLMTYRDDGSASYVGLERVVGSVGGRSGSFV